MKTENTRGTHRISSTNDKYYLIAKTKNGIFHLYYLFVYMAQIINLLNFIIGIN